MQSFKTMTASSKQDDIEVVYNLIFNNALYSLECIRSNGIVNDPNYYCYVENITEDETEAETFLHTLAKGKVLPVHIKDLVSDYFN